MILVKKITKAEMKINSTANFSQILQQVPHTGTSGFEPQLVTHEKICTSLENDQCSNTEHQNQTIHAYFMKSSNISCSTVYKPCFCLSLCQCFTQNPRLLLLNGALSVRFMWISCGVNVACRRYEDIVKDTLENVLDA